MLAIVDNYGSFILGLTYFELLGWFTDRPLVGDLLGEGEVLLEKPGPKHITLSLLERTDVHHPVSYELKSDNGDGDVYDWTKANMALLSFSRHVFKELFNQGKMYAEILSPQISVLIEVDESFGHTTNDQRKRLLRYSEESIGKSPEDEEKLRRSLITA